MRNRWVADIADFAKYGVLRRLCGRDLRLGIVWYLTDGDGNERPLIRYLNQPEPNQYSACDPELFAAMKRIISKPIEQQRVHDVIDCGVFPRETASFDEMIGSDRAGWLSRALKTTADCDVVFLDPDTGLERNGLRASHPESIKYAMRDDVKAFLARGQTVVVVQFGRPGGLERNEPVLARQKLAQLCASVNGQCATPCGVWWGRGHKVAMLIAPSQKHETLVRERIETMIRDWNGLLSCVTGILPVFRKKHGQDARVTFKRA